MIAALTARKRKASRESLHFRLSTSAVSSPLADSSDALKPIQGLLRPPKTYLRTPGLRSPALRQPNRRDKTEAPVCFSNTSAPCALPLPPHLPFFLRVAYIPHVQSPLTLRPSEPYHASDLLPYRPNMKPIQGLLRHPRPIPRTSFRNRTPPTPETYPRPSQKPATYPRTSSRPPETYQGLLQGPPSNPLETSDPLKPIQDLSDPLKPIQGLLRPPETYPRKTPPTTSLEPIQRTLRPLKPNRLSTLSGSLETHPRTPQTPWNRTYPRLFRLPCNQGPKVTSSDPLKPIQGLSDPLKPIQGLLRHPETYPRTPPDSPEPIPRLKPIQGLLRTNLKPIQGTSDTLKPIRLSDPLKTYPRTLRPLKPIKGLLRQKTYPRTPPTP
nr:proline-rich extensin-like protein EPR1 [Penaeus vannamei]